MRSMLSISAVHCAPIMNHTKTQPFIHYFVFINGGTFCCPFEVGVSIEGRYFLVHR